MKQIPTQNWFLLGLICLAVIVFCVSLVRSFGSRRKGLRGELLQNLRKHQVPFFMDDTHKDPIEKLKVIEKICREYKITEDELGVSLHVLLGHAVICQRKRIAAIESWLGNLKEYVDKLTAQNRPVQEWGAVMNSHYCSSIQSTVEALFKAQHEYKVLNERWIRANGQDAKNIIRLDTSVMHPA